MEKNNEISKTSCWMREYVDQQKQNIKRFAFFSLLKGTHMGKSVWEMWGKRQRTEMVDNIENDQIKAVRMYLFNPPSFIFF